MLNFPRHLKDAIATQMKAAVFNARLSIEMLMHFMIRVLCTSINYTGGLRAIFKVWLSPDTSLPATSLNIPIVMRLGGGPFQILAPAFRATHIRLNHRHPLNTRVEGGF